MSSGIITPEISTAAELPKITAVKPAGSKILVECLKPDEVMGTKLYVREDTKLDGAPQAYIVELGPSVAEDSGLAVGQRVYWTGNGTPVQDPRAQHGRVRALLEIHNVIAIIEDEGASGACCGGKCEAE